MNTAQRNFLIKKIQENVDLKIKSLRESRPDYPSINNWLLHAVLSNNFELKSIAEIKECLRQKALKATERQDWLGNSWGAANKNGVHFGAEEIFIVPEEYKIKADQCRKETQEIDNKIGALHIQADTLITRIQLASDKTLQTMINEVDDMGNISLLDTKLKLLTQ